MSPISPTEKPETPACYAVYEEADEEALVEEAGASLQSGSWKEEEA